MVGIKLTGLIPTHFVPVINQDLQFKRHVTVQWFEVRGYC